MKKLLSLLAVLGLVGSVAMPIYAQEADVNSDEEPIVVAVDDESDYEVNDDEIVLAQEEIDDVEEEVLDSEENIDSSIDDLMGTLDEEVETSQVTLEDIFNGDVSEEEFKAMLHEWAVSAGLTDEQATMFVGFFVGFGLAGLLVFLAISILLAILGIIALWKAFNRAGEGGWKAIIPIYNTYIMYKLAGMKNWFWYGILIVVIFAVVAACLPDYEDLLSQISEIICGIISIVATFLFARKYGWGIFASILFVLFNPICILFLGFGNYPYQGGSKETIVEA